jgi:hypothetical protein
MAGEVIVDGRWYHRRSSTDPRAAADSNAVSSSSRCHTGYDTQTHI